MKVVWTEQATRGWREVAKYIVREFGQRGLEQFQLRTIECEDAVAQFPNSGSIEWDDSGETATYRSCIVHRRSKMLYFVKDQIVYIADFWDVRANH